MMVGADEDISFASMVQPSVMSGNPRPRPKRLSAGPSFEFRSGSATPSSADMLFSNGKIMAHNPLPQEHSGRRRCLRQGDGRRSADTAPKRVSFQEVRVVPRRSASSPLPARGGVTVGDMIGGVAPRREAEKGRGFLGSIMMACRDCRAVDPSKQVVNVVN